MLRFLLVEAAQVTARSLPVPLSRQVFIFFLTFEDD